MPLRDLLKRAGKEGITSILVEGGREVFTSFIKENIADKIYIFLAPKIAGSGKDFIKKVDIMKEIKFYNIRKMDRDIMIEGYF